MGSRGVLKGSHLHAVGGPATMNRKGAADKNKRKAFNPEKPPAYTPDEPDWSNIFTHSKRAVADAHDEWEFTIAYLSQRGLLTKSDVTTVVDYCVCHARILQCERRLDRDGFMIAGERGPTKHPISMMLNSWRNDAKYYRKELGLTPASRARLGREEAPPPDDDSDLDGAPPV